MATSGDNQHDRSFGSVSEMLDDARSRLTRLDVEAAALASASPDCLLVDIRPAWQRSRDGEIVGSLIVERNHLEWRLHPGSESRLALTDTVSRWIVVCSEGFTSSLAADALRALGIAATDMVGGVTAWREAGFGLVAGPSQVETIVCSATPWDPKSNQISEDLSKLGGPHIEAEPAH